MNQQQREAMQQALDAMIQADIVYGQSDIDAAANALRQVLETPDGALIVEGDRPAQEPDGWKLTDAKGNIEVFSFDPNTDPDWVAHGFYEPVVVAPLYAAFKVLPVSEPVPAGWQVVPVELAPEMRGAWDRAPASEDDDIDMRNAYTAMLAAAPKPPATPPSESAKMLTLANKIAESACPGEESRLEVAYAIARHLGLNWPAAYPAAPVPEPVTDFEVEAACVECKLFVTRESVKDMRRALEGFAAGRAKGAAQ